MSCRLFVLTLATLSASLCFGGVTTSAPGWTFTEAERPSFTFTGRTENVHWMLCDWKGGGLKAGQWPEDGQLRLEPLPPGYYRVALTNAVGIAPRPFTFCVTRRDPCRDPDSFFAVDAAFSQCSAPSEYLCPWNGGDTWLTTAQLMGRCGLVHTRERLVWSRMAPERGRFDFTRYLENAKKLKANGVVSTGLFGDTPPWMRRPGRSLPGDLAETYRFCETAAKTFDPYYDAWEFWNEQELGSTREPVWEYVAALKAFALGVRAGSAKSVILPGSLSNIEHFGYGQNLFDGEIAKYVQAFNLHTYWVPRDLDKWHRDVRKFLSEAGVPDWQVWLTESGTDLESHGRDTGVMPKYRAHSPEQEMIVAEFAAKSMVLQRFGGIFRNWFFLFGCYNERHGEKDWGSMRRDGSVKPVHAVFSAISGELGGAKMLGEVKFGDGLRAFLYERKEGRKTLVAWTQSTIDLRGDCALGRGAENAREVSLKVPDGAYRLVDMMGTPRQVLAADGTLRLCLSRYPQYLTGDLPLRVDRPAASTGTLARYMPAADEDLTVVIRPEVSAEDFQITGRKCCAELNRPSGRIRLEVWNLSDRPKRGCLTFSCGTVVGNPPVLEIAAWGKQDVSVEWTPPEGDGIDFNLDIAGMFDGRRATRVRIPVSFRHRFLLHCTAVPLPALDRPGGWRRNDSADTYSCVYDEKERAVRFDVGWTKLKPAWFFPVHDLKLPEESLIGAKFIEFEVKTKQDKVENDFNDVLVMLIRPDGSVPYLPYQRPAFGWEKRLVRLPADAEAKAFRIGATPRGRHLTFWIRNVRILKEK